jgi:hypothetical protein
VYSIRLIVTIAALLPYIHAITCYSLCRLVTFPGTHNSNAIKNKEFIAESQQLGFKEQLAAGVRLFDLDFAGGLLCAFKNVGSRKHEAFRPKQQLSFTEQLPAAARLWRLN